MDVRKEVKGKEDPLVILDEEEWKEWTTITVQGTINKIGRALISDELYLLYRGMFINV